MRVLNSLFYGSKYYDVALLVGSGSGEIEIVRFQEDDIKEKYINGIYVGLVKYMSSKPVS